MSALACFKKTSRDFIQMGRCTADRSIVVKEARTVFHPEGEQRMRRQLCHRLANRGHPRRGLA